ncbi:T9SS type A sorting domain-containing protein [Fulvivirgaceae bacterium PWU4]|uniref:T9SS type A sorting domain-containing protein n=1 Tax=Chryseosolibacter histidini TaxID=2782349 RepID=A0AAP2DKC1_9BACT|nr:T9SS type A sorting domain-containing protein [Chryseosolibacter histidini]MBT1696928.1 T9SS type A sorting domain-containing protein [Chryseosolibacter histidini]
MMKSLTALFVLCSAIVATSNAQNIKIEVIKPSTLGLSKGHNLAVLVEVSSQLEIAAVIAKVGTTQVSLTLTDQRNVFGGTLPLTALQQGTHTMTITATDITNYAVSKDWPFIYDTPPIIEWEGPLDESTARSEVRVKAKCREENGTPCTISLMAKQRNSLGGFDFVSHAPGQIDADIDLSDLDGFTMDLVVTATDQYQAVTASRRIYIESSPYLKEVASVDALISDFDGNNIAYTRLIDGIHKPEIYDLQSSATVTVPVDNDIRSSSLMLTSEGLLFMNSWGPYLTKGLYAWNGTMVNQLTPGDRNVQNVKINGDYAVWIDRNYLYLRKFSDGLTQVVSDKGVSLADVAPDGTITYTLSNNVYVYKNGVHTRLTNDSPVLLKNESPLISSDGKIFYEKIEPCCGIDIKSAVAMHDGTSETLLRGYELRDRLSKQVNNGYIAYGYPGSLGQNQIWVRQPSGESHQVTFYGTSSTLELLNPSGDVITINGNTKTGWINDSEYRFRRYLSDKQGNSKEICSSQGKAFWANDKWYITMGRTLFIIDTVAEESRVNDISRTIESDTPLFFSREDFTSAFEGPGQLIRLSIIELPQHGYLTLPGGAKITAPVQLSRSVLDKLKYVPDPGYEGEDRIVWNASNGVAMPDEAAQIIVKIEKEEVGVPEEEIVTAVAAYAEDDQFSAHPNPAQDKLTLTFSHEMAGPIGVTVSNVQGQVMLSKILDENELGHERTHELNTSEFSPGIYLVRVVSSRQLKVKKIAVK